jgi:hypothetical protein
MNFFLYALIVSLLMVLSTLLLAILFGFISYSLSSTKLSLSQEDVPSTLPTLLRLLYKYLNVKSRYNDSRMPGMTIFPLLSYLLLPKGLFHPFAPLTSTINNITDLTSPPFMNQNPSLPTLNETSLRGAHLCNVHDALDVDIHVSDGVTIGQDSSFSIYNKLMGIPPSSSEMPLIYPLALTGPWLNAIVSHKLFPFNVIGSVHVSSKIDQERVIQLGESLVAHLKLEPVTRLVKKGTEFDCTCYLVDAQAGAIVWKATNTYLSSHRNGLEGKGTNKKLNHKEDATDGVTSTPQNNIKPVATGDWILPSNAGIEYASCCQDYNPIHVSRIGAILFGFKSMIAHGLFLTSKIVSVLKHGAGALPSTPCSLNVNFRRPCSIPSKVKYSW